ncbi:MAG: hypothetical protein GXP27_12110, partial [Planctomycetes bacterium]|nr:hypothetical protein [Planctomycetota bacterium]
RPARGDWPGVGRRGVAAAGRTLPFLVAVLTAYWVAVPNGMPCRAAQPAAADPAPETPKPKAQLDLRSLPGFEPTREPLPEMAFENELMTEEEEKGFQRSPDPKTRPRLFVFRDALRATPLSEAHRKAIAEGARWYIARFTMPKYRNSLFKLRQEIQRDIRMFAKSEAARQYFLAQLTNAAEEIIEPRKFKITHDHKQDITIEITEFDKEGKETSRTVKAKDVNELNALRQKDPVAVALFERYADRKLHFGGNGGAQNFLVRLNALLLLTELNSKDGNLMKGIPPVPYVPAGRVFLGVLNDPAQHEALRIPAVKGLARICLYGGLPRNDKLRAQVVDTFVRELSRKDIHWWYRKVLIEGLGASGVLYGSDRGTAPIVAQTLAEHLADPKRAWEVRAAAARALARAPLDNKINIDPIIYAIVNLGHQMAQQYNKKPSPFPWLNCYLDLYFAFKPISPDEKTSDGRKTAGFMASAGSNKKVQEAYNQLVPIIRYVLRVQGQRRIPKDRVAALANWLKNNQPGSFSIVPDGKPIVPASATTSKSDRLIAAP